jgi:hypothetical protein
MVLLGLLCSELFQFGRLFFFVICSASWPMASLSDCALSCIASLRVRDHWRSTNPTLAVYKPHTGGLQTPLLFDECTRINLKNQLQRMTLDCVKMLKGE